MGTNETLLRALEKIRELTDEGVTPAELAEYLGVSEETTRRAVKRLQDDELVTRNEENRIVATTRRGRRRIAVMERDERILKLLSDYGVEGATLVQVAEEAGTTPSLAYQTAWRLNKDGRIRREGSTRTARWVATGA